MKRDCMLLYITAVFMVLTGVFSLHAIEWEGIGEVSMNGELPPEGFFAAIDTNSVPLNTIIYIKNLETEKMVPVKVVKSLENPSLVAVLSKEAAKAIGMQGAKSRILMIEQEAVYSAANSNSVVTRGEPPTSEPAAPNVLNRSLESGSTNELVSEETLPDKSARSPAPALSSTPPVPSSESENTSGKDNEEIATVNPKPDIIAPPSLSKPNQTGIKTPDAPAVPAELSKADTGTDAAIKTVPPVSNTQKEDIAKAEEPAEAPQISTPAKNPDLLVKQDNSLKVTEKPVLEQAVVTPETSLPGGMAAIANADKTPDIHEKPSITDSIAPGPEVTVISEVPGTAKDRELSSGSETSKMTEPITPYDLDKYNLTLVPTEKRPPQERVVRGLPPESEIAPIAYSPSPSPPSAAGSSSGLPAEAEIASIESMLKKSQEENARLSASTPQIQDQFTGSGSYIFSVPLINSLERGKYYLQLLALSRPEMVEVELTRIGRTYPLAIQNIGNSNSPLYRILLGPVNRGESGALLAYFKNFGYRDAFVRQGS